MIGKHYTTKCFFLLVHNFPNFINNQKLGLKLKPGTKLGAKQRALSGLTSLCTK
jgi:hypothetical protein